jgi:hypothetical protein
MSSPTTGDPAFFAQAGGTLATQPTAAPREECAAAREREITRLGLLLAGCRAATLGLGVAKLLHERAHPAEWATAGAQVYDGFVSIDGFGERATLLLLQLCPLVLWLRPRVLAHSTGRLAALTLAVLLVATWAFRLPATPRLYWPVLALGAPLVAVALRELGSRATRMWLLALYVVANYSIAAVGTFAGA